MARLNPILPLLPICLATLVAVGCTEQHPQITLQLPEIDRTESVGGEVTKEVAVEKATTEKKKADQNKKQEVVKMATYNELNDFEKYVILRKGTERAGTGKLEKNKAKGTYICRRCNAALYKSDHKFASRCGWPSFDDEIKGAVRRSPDEDGFRIEILCKNCDGHLGHVFLGEGFTKKNTRHCVNSVSMKFIAQDNPLPKMIKLDDGSGEERSAEKEEPVKKDDADVADASE